MPDSFRAKFQNPYSLQLRAEPIRWQSFDRADIQLEQVTPKHSMRYYLHPDGSKFYSVTSMLAATKSDKSKEALKSWRIRVGKAESMKILEHAGVRGTSIHSLCESYLRNEKLNQDEYRQNKKVFNSISNELLNIDNVIACELPMFSRVLNLAGTADCIAEYKGVLSLIDFKTSRKEKKKEWIEDYYLQCVCYALMLRERYNIQVKQVVIIIGIDGHILPTVFTGNPKDYYPQLKKRLDSFQKLC